MKNNDQAFPVEYNGHKGMQLRDYFAAKAMQSLILTKHYQDIATDQPAMFVEMLTTLADESYDYADAMLRAREAA
jgi:hypothetical protein